MYGDVASRIIIKQGDITVEDVDAIVNAANSSLLGGGGVDGAIHRAAGPGLSAECAELGGCLPGDAKSTKGYRLKARYVIHTVGPIWHGGGKNEENILENAYKNSLIEAERLGVQTVAFPAISTGVYRFPPAIAAEIALKTVANFLALHSTPREVRLVCFSRESLNCHLHAKEALFRV